MDESIDVAEQLRSRLQWAVAEVFQVRDVTLGKAPGGGARLRGRLLTDATRAYDFVAPRLRELGYTALFRKDGPDDAIWAMPGLITVRPTRAWLSALMFVLTVLSCLYAGATMVILDPIQAIFHPLAGFPFAASLLSILLAHELGHYTVARLLGTPVSLPFFIPMPLGPFGTLGAFIQMKAPPTNRRTLLAIAAAGPLAGLVLAIPILILGLSMSPVQLIPSNEPVMMEGNSLLYALLKILVFGRFLPSGGLDVFLHPVAFAGWAGLLVTGLNLIPAGQLDGGHVVYALLGQRSRLLTRLIIFALILLGLIWSGWIFWAILVYVFGQRHAEPLDDLTRLDAPCQALAILLVIVFILVFTPIPLTVTGGG